MLTRALAWCAAVGPLVYVVFVSVLGSTWAGYDPVRDTQSELGALDSPVRAAMNIGGFMGLGAIALAFAGAYHLVVRPSWARGVAAILFALGGDNDWHKTACILCSINCGLEVRTDGRSITRVRGDKKHPTSRGYTCEKGLRVGHYQDSADRLTSPLRRRADGTFEEIDWDSAIGEIAGRFAAVRDEHGGDTIFYYGGGGQGNHLGGAYATATRAALGSVFSSNALAQEKTGEFWVDGLLYGRPRCHTTGDYEGAEVAVFVGKNPWQSHGFPRARTVLKAIAADPARAMVVLDPRRTETAELAEFHLQVRPGTDAWCLAVMVAVLVDEGLVDKDFVAEHTSGYDVLEGALASVDIPAFCARCGVDESLLREAVRRIAAASSVAIFEDLGVQQAPNSTLNSYLEKLLYLLTGNFAKPGTMNIHTRFASLGGGGGSTGVMPKTRPVTSTT